MHQGKHRLITALVLIAVLVSIAAPVSAAPTRYGGTLVTAQMGEPKTLNGNWSQDGYGGWADSAIFSNLVCMDVGCTVQPDLADSWEASADSKTFTFQLHPGVKWSDGQAFSSADVKYTYDTIIEKVYPGNKYLANVVAIETPDENTVVIKLSKPNVAFIPMLALAGNWFMWILPKHAYDGEDWQTGPHAKNPIGTGPFVLDEWVAGSHLVLKAKDDYFRGRVTLDELIIRFVPDVQVAIQAFNAGELDYLPFDYAPPYAELPNYDKNDAIRVIRGEWIYGENLSFNLSKAPWNNPKVRRAIAMVLDREELNEQAFDGTWPITQNAGIPAVPEFLNLNAKYPDFDLDGAKRLLDEVGLTAGADGVRIRTTIMDPPYEYDHLLTEALIEQLRRVGIECTWNKYDWDTWYTKLQDGDWELTVDYMRYAPDPNNYYDLYHTEGGRNFKRYSNAALDALLEAGRQESDSAARHEIFNQVQEILVADCADIVLVQEVQVELIKKNWHGVVYEKENMNLPGNSWMGFQAYWSETPPAAGQASNTLKYVGIAAAVVIVLGLGWFFLARRKRAG